MRLFEQQGANHILHLLITLFLCGLWIPVWILHSINTESSPYHCLSCGYADRYAYLANPNLRAEQIRLARAQAQQKTHTSNNVGFYKVGAIILGIFIFLAIIFVTANLFTKKTPPPIAETVKDARYYALETRRKFASETQTNLAAQKLDTLVTASGNDNEILTITTTTVSAGKINQKFAENFRQSDIAKRSGELGFKKIILDNRKRRWELVF